MVATLTPPFRLGLGSETRKKAGSAHLFFKSAQDGAPIDRGDRCVNCASGAQT